MAVHARRLQEAPAIEMPRTEAKQLAEKAVEIAGYKRPGAGIRLMKLPRIQAAMGDAFTRVGASIEDAVGVIIEIAHDETVDPGVRLSAALLRFRLTTGLAPT
ncbi:MAG: hypothetical protein DLM53_12805 [Candidatus Eremiobacter antarcticus]|nr:hypothetical protein [Candidatus Eremiobacteraeota bacterium]MBC5807666.1 hypothetical protein [Candidatus Eremiobacteraeota bacterium]PZR60518.1 MAG: hypothetical protein DLM53_12805 [Candidatus Eremiobacter sp. RRmetagenome_bin22]